MTTCERCAEVNPAEIHTCTPMHWSDCAVHSEPAYPAGECDCGGVQSEPEPVACIVKDCENHKHQGRFVGDLCSPCHAFITTNEGKHSQAYRNAQPEPSVEPVAWLFQHEDTGQTDCVDSQQVEWGFDKNNPRWQKIAPLYTAPPQREWQGLTDEQVSEIERTSMTRAQAIRAIEAKLKQKNA